MILKVKIIGAQVWTVENLTHLQFRKLSGRSATLRNEISDWVKNQGPASCTSISSVTGKKTYLFNQIAVRLLEDSFWHQNLLGWRIPDINDCFNLFKYIDPRFNENYWPETLANNLRGANGWQNNGTNKIGFNGTPYPSRKDDGTYIDAEVASWWATKGNELIGLGIYPDIDVVAECGTTINTGKPIRLVMDLTSTRIEEGITYV